MYSFVSPALCGTVLLAALSAPARGQTWTGTGSDQNWSTGGNWNTGTVPSSLATTAVTFAGTTGTNPLLDLPAAGGPFSLNALTFGGTAGAFIVGQTGGRTLLFTGTNPTLTQSSAQNQRLALPVMFAATSGPAKIAGAGAGPLTLDQLVLSGGGLTLERNVTVGAIQLGDFTGSNPAQVTGPGTIALGSGITITDRGGQVDPPGLVDVNFSSAFTGTGGLTLDLTTPTGGKTAALSGANSYGGATTINLNSGSVVLGATNTLPTGTALTVNLTPGGVGAVFLGVAQAEAGLSVGDYSQTVGALNGNGNIVTDLGNGGATLTVGSGNGSGTFSGAIDGAGGLTKTGTGTQILSGTSTYAGGTAVNGGTLRVDGSLGATTVTVNTNGILAGAGTLGGTVEVKAGGAVRAGTSTASHTLTVAGDVKVSGSSTTPGTMVVDLFGANASGATVGTLAVTGGANALNFDTTTGPVRLYLANDGGVAWGSPYTFKVATSGGGFEKNGSAVASYMYGVDFTLSSDTFGGFTGVSLIASEGNLNLSFTPVPEPGLILGVAAVGLRLARATRRRGTGLLT